MKKRTLEQPITKFTLAILVGQSCAAANAGSKQCDFRNLVYLNTEEVTHLDESSINHLLSRLGPRLLGLFLDGEGIGDGAFANLNKCKKLEVNPRESRLGPPPTQPYRTVMLRLQVLGVTFAELMGSAGLEAISALSGLTSLKVRRGKELRAEDFVRAFR